MMWRFEHDALDILLVRLEDACLRLFFRIARKQHRKLAEHEAADDGFIVRVVLVAFRLTFFHERGRRTQDFELDAAAKIEDIAFFEALVLNLLLLGLLHIVEIEPRRRRHAVIVNGADFVIIIKQHGHAADMVGMRMRQDDLVDFLDAGLLELLAELVALIDIARINEDGLLGCLDEDGVALSDIEHLDRQAAIRSLRTACTFCGAP